jgi:hypothetical protein
MCCQRCHGEIGLRTKRPTIGNYQNPLNLTPPPSHGLFVLVTLSTIITIIIITVFTGKKPSTVFTTYHFNTSIIHARVLRMFGTLNDLVLTCPLNFCCIGAPPPSPRILPRVIITPPTPAQSIIFPAGTSIFCDPPAQGCSNKSDRQFSRGPFVAEVVSLQNEVVVLPPRAPEMQRATITVVPRPPLSVIRVEQNATRELVRRGDKDGRMTRPKTFPKALLVSEKRFGVDDESRKARGEPARSWADMKIAVHETAKRDSQRMVGSLSFSPFHKTLLVGEKTFEANNSGLDIETVPSSPTLALSEEYVYFSSHSPRSYSCLLLFIVVGEAD